MVGDLEGVQLKVGKNDIWGKGRHTDRAHQIGKGMQRQFCAPYLCPYLCPLKGEVFNNQADRTTYTVERQPLSLAIPVDPSL